MRGSLACATVHHKAILNGDIDIVCPDSSLEESCHGQFALIIICKFCIVTCKFLYTWTHILREVVKQHIDHKAGHKTTWGIWGIVDQTAGSLYCHNLQKNTGSSIPICQ